MSLAWDEYRARLNLLADGLEEWQGIPVHLPDSRLILTPKHPLAKFFQTEADAAFDQGVVREFEAGDEAELDMIDQATNRAFACTTSDIDYGEEHVRNHWYSWARHADVYVVENAKAISAVVGRRSPDRSMDRLTFWLETLGASDAWDEAAEHKAREKLRGMLTERQWRHYDLTGSFLETSPRSRVMYVFRRLRPTIAMVSDQKHEHMLCLAVLCLHPIGYYASSWAGAMVPTDDVICHLMAMRGDEAFFWRKSNLHEPKSAEAGL